MTDWTLGCLALAIGAAGLLFGRRISRWLNGRRR